MPIFSFHRIRNWAAADSEADRPYITPPIKLEAELRYIQENGYHSVTSEQIYEY